MKSSTACESGRFCFKGAILFHSLKFLECLQMCRTFPEEYRQHGVQSSLSFPHLLFHKAFAENLGLPEDQPFEAHLYLPAFC